MNKIALLFFILLIGHSKSFACSGFNGMVARYDCNLGIVYLDGFYQGINLSNTIIQPNQGIRAFVSSNPNWQPTPGLVVQNLPAGVQSVFGQYTSNGFYAIPIADNTVDHTYYFSVWYLKNLTEMCKRVFKVEIPACACGSKANAFITSIEDYTTVTSNVYGNMEIPIVCDPILDASGSYCDDNHFLSITQFNPVTWTNVGNALFQGWIGGASPQTINLNSYANFAAGHFYMVQYAVGPNWDAEYIVFQKSSNNRPNCCLLNLYRDNETVTGTFLYQRYKNIWGCTQVPNSSDAVNVLNGADLHYRATRQITLEAGFNVQPGAVFFAEIGPEDCVQAGDGKNTDGDSKDVTVRGRSSVWESTDESSGDFTIFPNPSDGKFTIKIAEQKEKTHVQIFDIVGRLKKDIIVTDPVTTIDASAFDNGIYIVVVATEGEVFKEKIVISK